MRYQTLILIVVILLSGVVTKASLVSSDRGTDTAVSPVDALAFISPAYDAFVSRPVVPLETTIARVEDVSVKTPEEDTKRVTASCESLGASVAYVRTMRDGSILFDRESVRRWPIASITKLMTAVVALERYDTSAPVNISADALVRAGGFSTFSEGTTLSVNDMVRALVVGSSNDAAFALADIVGQETFVGYMQAKAKELGMGQSLFSEPSGLSYLNQSTAPDLYMLLRYIQTTHPYLLESTRLKTITVQDLAQKKRKTVANINQFAGRSDFLGGKTGFIDQSGGNLVSLFRVNGEELFFAVLGSSDRFAETSELVRCVDVTSAVASQ